MRPAHPSGRFHDARMAANCRDLDQRPEICAWRYGSDQAKMAAKASRPGGPQMLRLKLTRARFAAGLVAATALACLPNFAAAQSGDPIKIGFGMSLTGTLAANGKQALLGMKIWEEE